ncbi:hypothetical protein HYPSUDRAFT_68145 [Hypholoma sublateritium FD-334 SS-4]|uniref:Protein kinase domain-containing protein n=1 Tax=Hypholoma sublateritium (strain FD-334 SS-4) TaxID=945553 RepID=A0A0D2MBK9_HYPSF|nr:hypothetical protein HYPSUDRAFT_68145 [Hypholoma sublateritium FD-334 SS-4]
MPNATKAPRSYSSNSLTRLPDPTFTLSYPSATLYHPPWPKVCRGDGPIFYKDCPTMEVYTENGGRDEAWSACISPLLLSSNDSTEPPRTLRLDIGEFEAEPFSTKFMDMFGGLGLHMAEDATATQQISGTPDTSYEYEKSLSNIRDLASGWQYPGIEELVAISSKRPRSNLLPTIQEESRCSIVPTASLSDFEFEFDAFDRPSANGTTICTRRDSRIMYTMKRKRAARNSLWHEQSILETLTTQDLPFISRLCWSFHSGEHIYIVTDHHGGHNLEDLVRDQGPLSIYHATFYAAELALAIASLHSSGIMHRDLEPRNVQIDSQGHILLTSFGSAEFVREVIEGEQRASHMSGLRFVSSVYRAPEITLGWTHDCAVDCWSFGMVLYYMVFGTTPYTNVEGREDDHTWVFDRVIRSAIPMESLRLVHPMARDLILKCLERNPELRWDMTKIKSHSYFASSDWQKVSSLQAGAPLFGKPPVRSLKAHSTRVDDGHQRNLSLSPQLLNYHHQAAPKVTPTLHRLSQPFQRPGAPEPAGDDTPMSPVGLFRSLGRAMSVLHEDDSTGQANADTGEDACGRHAFEANPECRISQFWDELDREEAAASVDSLEFGATTGAPYNKAPKLRKYQSAIQSRSRLFNVSTSSFQNKMRRKPRSTGALRQPKPVRVIENLPLGIHQIGSGIGFSYSVPAAAPSKVSIGSFTPSCHLFQKGFSVRNIGLTLGNSSTTRVKTKSSSPELSRSPRDDTQIGSPMSAHLQRKEVGNGTFIREMTRSPSWILSPSDCLPSPMALVNVDSPMSMASGSALLSPATLVERAGEDDDCHVNITIPKGLELELDLPLAEWAPDATLRLVPQTSSSIRLPYIDDEDESMYMDQSWA